MKGILFWKFYLELTVTRYVFLVVLVRLGSVNCWGAKWLRKKFP